MSKYKLIACLISLGLIFTISSKNQYESIGANVRIGGPVGMQEQLYRDARLPIVKKAQEKFLDMELDQEDTLEIAFSLSGGGWRAMCCSTGSMLGAEKIGLLGCSTYISSLSGSTWFLAPWIYSDMNIYDFRRFIIDVASTGIDIKSAKEFGTLFDDIWVKFSHHETVNIIDFYGALLANSLMRGLVKDPHKTYLSEQRKFIDKGQRPMPIYTAILGEKGFNEYWYEFTPYEVGTRWLNAYIPIWSFGRVFDAGISVDYVPEQYMGFLMGIFGSAFAANFKEFYDQAISKVKLPSFLDLTFTNATFSIIKTFIGTLANSSAFGDIRLFWAKVPNYTYNIKNSEFGAYKNLKLADAGVSINNPVFVTYRKMPLVKAPDIIFIFDAGGSVGYGELKTLADYADHNGFKFPQIQYFEVNKQIITVFQDDRDMDTPVIVYMPRINPINLIDTAQIEKYYTNILKDFDIEKEVASGFAHTFNFKYTKRNAETLIAMTELNILSVQETIKKIMVDRINLKRKFRTIF